MGTWMRYYKDCEAKALIKALKKQYGIVAELVKNFPNMTIDQLGLTKLIERGYNMFTIDSRYYPRKTKTLHGNAAETFRETLAKARGAEKGKPASPSGSASSKIGPAP